VLVSRNNNVLRLEEFDNYIRSSNFEKFILVVEEYCAKYQAKFNQVQTQLQLLAGKDELSADKNFDPMYDQNSTNSRETFLSFQLLVAAAVRQMNHLIRLRTCYLDVGQLIPEQLQTSVVLLDYLVTLYQLVFLVVTTFGDYDNFAKNSKIEHIVDGKPVQLNKDHYLQIRQKIYTLNI
jgi:hypothetical protein